MTKQELEKNIFKLLKQFPKKRFKPKRIASKLSIKNSRDSILDALKSLTNQGKAYNVIDDLYKLDDNAKSSSKGQKGKEAIGRVDLTKSGAAYIILEGDGPDIYVPKKYVKSAMHDDEVKVSIHLRRGAKKPEGKIIEIINRAHKKFVGTYNRIGGHGVVDVSLRSAPYQIELTGKHEAKSGDRVVVKVVHYSSNGTIKGEIETILSSDKAHDIEMNSILINEGFDIAFSPELLKATNELNDNITEKDLSERKDLREVLTFTIDPADAKDFDDAISYRVLENGDEEIGVHIADVSHFVKEGSAIDKEALLRSTSVYLVDRVCPMLPERLSNELCSLRPNEDKFTFSAVFTFGKKGKVKNRWFGKTLTHSDKRFTYEEAQEIMDAGEGYLYDELMAVNSIAHILRDKRYDNGSIKFETEELRFTLDDNNEPEGVYVKERKDTHLLVEDFMLLANQEVSKFINRKEKDTSTIPFVYRIHDQPDPDKLADFALLAHDFGLKFNLNTPKEIAKSFNAITQAEDSEEYLSILMPLAIRTMAKAEYSTENIGHYGLGFEYYSHFTSPIRRYADLLVHRILAKNLNDTLRVNAVELEQKCKHISKQERKAIGAERESTKYMQAVYMQNKIGESFAGRVSGIIEKGIFVETLDSKAEGLIPFGDIGMLKALSTGSALVSTPEGDVEFKFGKKVNVELVKVNVNKRLIDFRLLDDTDQ